jgi:hypothetical protein
MNTPKPLQIFRAGRHVAMSGQALDFSAADLAATAKAYDPAKHEAPLVVGHPTTDGPAYGWVKTLGFSDGLQATPDQVDPAFAELVTAGRYKKISASFFAPNSPQNPVPGVYYLRHVGFLGATPPAVKGLRTPAFAADQEGIVHFSDSEQDDVDNASLWRRLREFIIGKFSIAEADQVAPEYLVKSLEQSAQQEVLEAQQEAADPAATASGISPDFAESIHQETRVTPQEKAALEAENAQLKSRLAEADARDQVARLAATRAHHASFAEALVQSGQLAPGIAPVIVASLDAIAAHQGTVLEFGEGEAKKPLATALMEALKSAPKVIEFGEVSRDSGAAPTNLKDPQAIVDAARKLQAEREAAGTTVSFAEAVALVTTAQS